MRDLGRVQSTANFTICSGFFTGDIALQCHWVHFIVRLLQCRNLHKLKHSPLVIRAGNHWWVSDQLGKEDGFMRAEVGEADMKLPPVKGWEVYKPGTGMFSWTGEWSSKGQTLQCSRHPSGDFAGYFVPQNQSNQSKVTSANKNSFHGKSIAGSNLENDCQRDDGTLRRVKILVLLHC